MAISEEAGRSLADRQRQLETLDRLSQRFGQSLSGALQASTNDGKQLSGILDRISGSLAGGIGGTFGTVLTAGLQNAARALSAAASSFSFGAGAFPFAKGGVLAGGSVAPFAAGGVVAAPTYFPLGRGLGLMGEAGPEAVLPLARGPDGRLGVRTPGGSGNNITVNITATDLESFKRSEAQVSAALARAVARGRRAS